MAKKNTISNISRLGIAGALVFGAAGAMAETFNATVNVQNALAVTNVADLDFGTVFATTASDAESASLTLAPNGDVAEGPTGASFQLLSLGTPVPAQASVAVGSQATFTVTLPDVEATVEASGGGATVMDDSESTPIYLCAAGACGNAAVPRFELVNFRLGEVTSGSIADDSDPRLVTITPSFGVTEVGFNIGATIVTDTDVDASRSGFEYAPDVPYTGTFEVTASY